MEIGGVLFQLSQDRVLRGPDDRLWLHDATVRGQGEGSGSGSGEDEGEVGVEGEG